MLFLMIIVESIYYLYNRLYNFVQMYVTHTIFIFLFRIFIIFSVYQCEHRDLSLILRVQPLDDLINMIYIENNLESNNDNDKGKNIYINNSEISYYKTYDLFYFYIPYAFKVYFKYWLPRSRRDSRQFDF